MPLTPADVANKQFKIAFRGYSLDEVDAFLDEVEGELGRLLRENSDLKVGIPAVPPAPHPAAAPTLQPAAAPAPAPLAPGEGQEAALRTLLLAQRTADEAVAEARAEAAKIVADAQFRADNVDGEIAARIHAAMGGLEQRKRELEVQIEDLRAFEREYRTRLKAYLEGQLRDLSARGAPDDGGAGVPAAARTAAVGLGPAAGTQAGAPAPPPTPRAATPPPTPPATPPPAPPTPPPSAPAPPVPSYRPAEPPLAPLPPAAPPAPPAPPSAPPAQSAPAAPPPPTPVFTPPPPAAVPQVAPDPSSGAGPQAGPPDGPPREAEPAPLRAVPPLQTSLGAEPIGPFTIVPPSSFMEELDDGPEPPAEH